MGTAYLDITITAAEGAVTLFECECVAEVEYVISKRDGLSDWHISNLRFDQCKSEWNDTERVWTRKKVASIWANKPLFAVLRSYIDDNYIEALLTDVLIMSGELSYSSQGVAH